MLRKLCFGGLLATVLLILTACEKTSAEILEKAKNASTTAALKDAIGDPDKIDKAGPLATWTYETSDGQVTFAIVGDTVTLSTAKSKE